MNHKFLLSRYLLPLFITVVTVSNSYALNVAITVDDLPSNGEVPVSTTKLKIAEKMLQVFKKHHIKGVYGLLNGVSMQSANSDAIILQKWIDGGQLIGNHTYHHLDLAKVSSEEYIKDIQRNELILKSFMANKNYHFFRYPYLSEGNTQEKRDTVRKYLFNQHYQIAPVTVDFFEYEWNAPYVRCLAKNDKQATAWLKQSYLEQALNALTIAHELSMMLYQRDINNVLLIHINAMTVDMLDELLSAYEKQGVKFISLDEALSDKIYDYNPDIVRDRAYTFLNQVRLSKGLKNPDLVERLYASLPEDKLDSICR